MLTLRNAQLSLHILHSYLLIKSVLVLELALVLVKLPLNRLLLPQVVVLLVLEALHAPLKVALLSLQFLQLIIDAVE